MNSLEELNAHSRTSISITDDRPAGVIFDRAKPYINFDFSSQITYDGNPYFIEFDVASIEEIPNWETAQCYYMVEVLSDEASLINDTGIFFDIIEGGVTQEPPLVQIIEDDTDLQPEARAAVRVQYFKTKNEWIEFGKGTFTWTFPSVQQLNTSLLYYIRVSLNWIDAETNSAQRIRWEIYDPEWYYEVKMESEFSFIGDFDQTKSVQANLIVTGSVLSASTGRQNAFANLVSSASISTKSTVFYRITTSISSSFSIGITDNLIKGMTGLTNEVYFSNSANQLFDQPIIVNDANPQAQITITLSSPNGEFGTLNSAFATYSFTGTPSQINANWTNIRFWPNKDFTSTSSYTYTQAVGGVTRINKTFTLFYSGSGFAIEDVIYEFTNSATWTPSVLERKYQRMSFAVQAGGGGGAGNSSWDIELIQLDGRISDITGGGGGAAGQFITVLDQQISNNSYTVTVGQGGSGGNTGLPGSIGGNSSFNGVIAQGGRAGLPYNGTVPTRTGANSNYPGQIGYNGGFGPSTAQQRPFKAGQGAGTGGNGLDNGQAADNGRTEFLRPYLALRGGRGGAGGGLTIRTQSQDRGDGGNGSQTSVGNTQNSITTYPSEAGIGGRVYIITHT
jgi:hypothetical protein